MTLVDVIDRSEVLFQELLDSRQGEQRDMLRLFLQLALFGYERHYTRADGFEMTGGGAFLMCESCVTDAPLHARCHDTCRAIAEASDRVLYRLEEFQSDWKLVRVIKENVEFVAYFSEDSGFCDERFRARYPWDQYESFARETITVLRRRFSPRDNVWLNAVLAHRLDILCRCPFGLRPKV